MNATIALRVNRAIGSVQTLDASPRPEQAAAASGTKELAAMKSRMQSACEALTAAAQQTEQYGQRLFAVHREQIIRLAIEIASRIVAHRVEQNDYAIETILSEAIAIVPGGSILEIRVNPDDLKTYEQSVQSGLAGVPESIKLVADWSIGKAECIVVTNEGLIEWTRQEHLRQIEAALQAAHA